MSNLEWLLGAGFVAARYVLYWIETLRKGSKDRAGKQRLETSSATSAPRWTSSKSTRRASTNQTETLPRLLGARQPPPAPREGAVRGDKPEVSVKYAPREATMADDKD